MNYDEAIQQFEAMFGLLDPPASYDLDQIEALLEKNVELGYMEHASVVDGEQRYRVTPAGEEKVREIFEALGLPI